MQSDSELVEQVKAGDLQAFAELVARYEYAVRGMALAVLGNYHSAEDAAQDAFVAAYEKLGLLRDGSRFGPWLLKIAKRQALSRVKATRRPAALDQVAEPADPRIDAQLDAGSEQLLRLVQRLPEHERAVLVLRHFEGHDVRQIAEITGRPVGTVTKQLSRAYERLRHWLLKESCS